MSGSPPQVTTYNKAIKVTVDGPREPRSKTRKQLLKFLFVDCELHNKTTMVETIYYIYDGISERYMSIVQVVLLESNRLRIRSNLFLPVSDFCPDVVT